MATCKRHPAGRRGPHRPCARVGGQALPLPQRPLPSPLSSVPSSRSALTLIEMLVVISILVLLAAATVPNIRPALENRRVRETARSVEAFLNRARIDAIERGIPVGVEFVRADRQNEACVMLRQVVAQPPYTGEDDNATLNVILVGNNPPQITATPSAGSPFTFDTNYVMPGDLIQFGSRAWNPSAPTYEITAVAAASLSASLVNWRGVAAPWPTAGGSAAPQQFVVYRHPNVSSPLAGAVASLQLPDSMCIDLYESGTGAGLGAGTNDVCFAPRSEKESSVFVMFGPDGKVRNIFATNPDDAPNSRTLSVNPTERLYFLVGRRDRLPDAAVYPAKALSGAFVHLSARGEMPHEDGRRNWEDLNNLWVSIIPQTGMTVTIENTAFSRYGGADYANTSVFSTPADRLTAMRADLRGARGLAQKSQSMGGR